MPDLPRIAVDAVLLPPTEIMDLAISANRRLQSPDPQKIVLDREHCLPHISLAMASVRETDLPQIGNILFRIADRFRSLELGITRQFDLPAADGRRNSRLEVFRTPDLQALHEALMEAFRTYTSVEVTRDQFVTPPPINKGALEFVGQYPEESAYARFAPHITLGTGYGETPGLPVLFKADRLALCHLGSFCTCRKILFDFTLKKA